MASIEALKRAKKLHKLTLDELAARSGVAKRTIEDIFQGKTKNPRVDTMQALESALGLAPTFTEEERALGLSDDHPIVLSDDDRELINLFAEAEEKLGKAYVRGVKQMVRLAIDTKGQP